MKTIDEIRNLTKKAIKDKEEKARIAAEKAKVKAKKDHAEMIERANDVSSILEHIEEMAKKGKNTYSISIGEIDGSEYDKLRVAAIKKQLKDFNPTFTEERVDSCEYNYEGNSIDGTEYWYTVNIVTFNW